MNIQINEGMADRVIRAIVAIALVVLALSINGGWALVFYILSALILATAISGTCLLYKWMGINTNHSRT